MLSTGKLCRMVCLGVLSCGSAVRAEDANRMIINSRAAEIEAQRQEKARMLAPEEPDKIERTLQFIKEKKILERITRGAAGVRVRLGGLVTGAGFAAGPEYYRRLRNEQIIVRTSVRASMRQSCLMDAELNLPRLAGDHVFLDLYGAHRNFTRMDYYGPGPDSEKTGRSVYSYEDTSFEVRTGVTPISHLRIGGFGRYVMINVGPGHDDRFVSSERIYSPAAAPGIGRQSNYLQGGPFIQFDTRDNRGGPRSGINYVARFLTNSDRDLRLGSFARLELEAEHYIPLLHQRRVIALRARGLFTEPHAGQFVPFYLQPSLGGSDDLRGYRAFRFRDNNALVLNAEYRWEVFSGLDMALFADAGNVFHHWEQTSLHGLKKSYGFGFRFNVRNDVFLRVDTGFSREGFQVWFKFNNVF